MKMSELFTNHNSDFLFARPSFLGGMARIFDFGGTLKIYNDSPNGAIADEKALRADWKAVGDCLRSALAEYRSSIRK
jgi:hypothetical protein